MSDLFKIEKTIQALHLKSDMQTEWQNATNHCIISLVERLDELEEVIHCLEDKILRILKIKQGK